MDAEKFIEEIRKCPVLYDQSNEKYRNVDYKERIWKLIATTLELEGGVDECKKKWNSIRDQLRRTLQKRKTKSGQAAAKTRKYKYEDILTFLLPHLSEREGLTNVPQVVNQEDVELEFGNDLQDISSQGISQEENLNNVDEHHSEGEIMLTGTSKDTTIWSKESSKYQSIVQVPSKNQLSAKNDKFAIPSVTKRKIPGREVKPEESPASKLMAYILAEKDAEKQKAPILRTYLHDPVDAFLCGIASTLKSLDAILLNEAKGKIFGIVQELELKQLQLNSGSQARCFVPNYSTSPSLTQLLPSEIPSYITIPNYSTSHSSSSEESPSALTPLHPTTADQTINHNELSYNQL